MALERLVLLEELLMNDWASTGLRVVVNGRSTGEISSFVPRGFSRFASNGTKVLSNRIGSTWVGSLRGPRLRGLLVPGGAERLTVQYEPKPGSVTGLGSRSNRRLRER